MELLSTVQTYDWGKLGRESIVAKLKASADPNTAIDDNKPYAELWVGTHPNGPSLIIERNVWLSEYIKDNVDAIGPAVRNKFGVEVPFLLKILSIRKALSIQAHPKKEHAVELNRNFPEMYKDANHKPELAIALSHFEALCGFRPLQEIKDFVSKIPELQELLSKEALESFLAAESHQDTSKLALKSIFQSLMTCDKTRIASGLSQLLSRLQTEDEKTQSTLLYPLLQRIHSQFPGDVGCFSLYFLNYLQLNPGEAIFLAPNMPHAYLSGDCVECMACSDNVVRAGLTPKHIDVPTLVEMLDYGSYSKSHLLFNPQLEDANTCVWRPPVEDFAVVRIKVSGDEEYNTIIRPSPSLLIFTEGEGIACDTVPIAIKPGVTIFLKASRQLTLKPAAGKCIEAYQAICNVN